MTKLNTYAIITTAALVLFSCKTGNLSSSAISNTPTCTGNATPALTEGPYYAANSPQRNKIYDGEAAGKQLTLTGHVYNEDCEPIAGVWLDFWQADGNGDYDNTGHNFRGHQFTNQDGKYELQTVFPAEYPGRTPHIHVKIRKPNESAELTTQLFFPNEAKNASDSIFSEANIVQVTDGAGTFNFVLP